MKKTWLLSIVALGLLVGCQSENSDADQTLRIYNWGGYIYEQETSEDDPSVIDQFEAWYQETYGETVTVEYSTYDVNETAYSQIAKLGKQFDLVCPSEYMIQKMIKEDLLEKYDRTGDSYTYLPNYNDHASPYLKNIFKNLEVEGEALEEYAAGYMWGTVGLIYDPEIVNPADATSWQVLYNPDYAKQATIKKSMRETYMIGVIDVYHDELMDYRADYLNSLITAEQYNAAITEIINRSDPDTLALVEESLRALKANSYGLEVDSGKNDIASGKIGMQVSWSGDAVYSMDLVEDETSKELEYVVPEEGGNVWFDGWVMPKGSQTRLAQEFVNFVSNPEIAILNMDYIGYTSFIAGQDVLDRVHEMEDPDGDFELDLTYFFEGTVEPTSDMVVMTVENRQLQTQYPDEETITRSIVMRDFGDSNEDVVALWARIKTSTVDTLTIVIVAVIVVLGVGVGLYFYFKKKNSKRGRRSSLKKHHR
ncbi:MAG: extracellular solute-binding protein [Bacilli bacterium]|jgi:spermidine/putrescine transport system substrate-binding protein